LSLIGFFRISQADFQLLKKKPEKSSTMTKPILLAELAEHNGERSCWLAIHGKVYDLTNFLGEHPGGRKVLLKHAGTDSSKQFDAFHSPGTLDKYGPKFLVGDLVQDKKVEETAKNDTADTFGDLVPFGDPYCIKLCSIN
jgi:cytochrome b involved in lipid metabolism